MDIITPAARKRYSEREDITAKPQRTQSKSKEREDLMGAEKWG
jgi:hypothetical protein